jgi:hypothetical protein
VRRAWLAGAALAIAAGAGAGCGTAAPAAAPPAASSPASSSPAPSLSAVPVTCAGINGDLSVVLSDLRTEDAALQEAWVTGGDSADLQTLIDDTGGAVNGANQLNTDAVTFHGDATEYLSDNSPDLSLGWQSGYGLVTQDINQLAKDCGLATVPQNTPANS